MMAKKLLAVFVTLVVMLTNAYAGSDSDYAKTVTGEGGVLYSLTKTSKSMMHVFDAMPKIRLYKYSGTAATKYFGKGDRGNDKSPHGRTFFPSVITNHQYYEMEYNMPTANEKNMSVIITDLDRADEGTKIEYDALVAEFKKLGLPSPPPYEKPKAVMLAVHRELFEGVAKNSKDAQKLRVSTRFSDIDEAYVAGYDTNRYYEGMVKNRYLIKINLSDVDTLNSTDAVEAYIDDYVSKLGLKGLPPSLDKLL
jgi:hypothetical protein